MTAKDITQKVLETIDAGHIMPRPRWHFIVRNVIVWAVGILCIFIGSVAVSVIIFTFTHGAWNAREVLGHGAIGHFMAIFPVIWAVLFVIFMIIAEYAVRATQKGYRYSIAILSGFIIIGSIVGGTLLHATGVSEWTDATIGKQLPRYETVERRQQRMLYDFEHGRLIGIVEDVQNDKIILYNSVTDQRYEIFLTERQDVSYPPLAVGMRIAVLFVHNDAGVMYAQQIFPIKALHKHSNPERRQFLQRGLRQDQNYAEEHSREQNRVFDTQQELRKELHTKMQQESLVELSENL